MESSDSESPTPEVEAALEVDGPGQLHDCEQPRGGVRGTVASASALSDMGGWVVGAADVGHGAASECSVGVFVL